MAFQHGKSIFVLLNGHNITGYLNKIDTSYTADTSETTTFGDEDKKFIPGLKDAILSAEGFFDGDANAVDIILDTILAGTNIGNNMIWSPQGNVIGNTGYAVNMVQTAYSVMKTKDDAVKISMAGHSSVGRERIKLIHELKSEAAIGTSASQDLIVAGANGGSAYIHATAITGTFDCVIQHSNTGTFTGEETILCTFTQLTALGHERLTFAGAVKRYVRVSFTITTGPAVFCVAICKK